MAFKMKYKKKGFPFKKTSPFMNGAKNEDGTYKDHEHAQEHKKAYEDYLKKKQQRKKDRDERKKDAKSSPPPFIGRKI